MMFELREVIAPNGSSWLQSRYREACADATGALCGFTDWSDWEDIPVVYLDGVGKPESEDA